MKRNKKLIALVCTLLLLVGAAGATLAWLTDQTQEVTNTFTVGNIDIELDEEGAVDTNGDEPGEDQSQTYTMVPGYTYDKDPIVTVTATSEDCWLFVEVTEDFEPVTVDGKTYGFDAFIKYDIVDGWEEVAGITVAEGTKVYAMQVTEPSAAGYNIINNGGEPAITGKVTVKDTVTKKMMDAVSANNYPQLVFKAYAHQLYSNENGTIFDVKDAWNNVKSAS